MTHPAFLSFSFTPPAVTPEFGVSSLQTLELVARPPKGPVAFVFELGLLLASLGIGGSGLGLSPAALFIISQICTHGHHLGPFF